jgi:MFS superfamily sulfate permease-like transporter
LAERGVLLINHCVLFLCASIYFGTGVSLVFFQFPSFPQLTVSNYYLYVVPPVDRATEFFTYMTGLMYLTGGLLLLAELRTGLRWIPITVLSALTASTLLTVFVVFRDNDQLRAGISDPDRLTAVLGNWQRLNYVRAAIWTTMWLAMMSYFAARTATSIRARA